MVKPNIIVITVDGMRWNDLGATGNSVVRTPNLDALASHGLCFTQAVADRPHARLHTKSTASDGPAEVVGTLLSRLGDAGYATGVVGSVAIPESLGAMQQLVGVDGSPDDYLEWVNHESPSSPSGGMPPEEAQHVTTWIGNQAVRFCQSAIEPFVLVAGFPAPSEPPMPWRTMYDPKALDPGSGVPPGTATDSAKKCLGLHYGAIGHMDRQVGRLLATLTGRGRTNNVFILTSTKGAYLGDHGLFEEESGPLYDALLRVPLLVGGLLGQRKGETDPALVTMADVSATLLDVLQLDTSSLSDSRSFTAQLHRSGLPHRKVVAIQGRNGQQALRTARYKWIQGPGQDGEALYDLQADPDEAVNIIDTRRALAIRKMLTGLE
tara:strand:- start:516 stop:1652 length:1137 start_codon:yes stop_codon:yes gene_type:complete